MPEPTLCYMNGMGRANYHTQFETPRRTNMICAVSPRSCLGNIKAYLKRHIPTNNQPFPYLALSITASGVRYKISSGNIDNMFAIRNTTGANIRSQGVGL